MSLGSIVDSIFGGGGGGGGQTTSTVQNTNIPAYAQPYVENMLGATQNQLFNTQQVGGTPVLDENGNPTGETTGGTTEITGFKPYQAYGGTYDAQGNQLSYDPSKAIAGFSPMQAQAQQGIAGMQTPGEYGAAKGVTGAGIMNAARLGSSANPQDFQSQVGGYMNPYMQQVLDPQMAELRRQYGISGVQQQGAATQAGAFGGSREAIMNAENQRNLMNAQNQAIGNAYNQAFGAAQNQYNQGQGFQLQANQAAMQGAGQLAGLGQQELAAQQGIYGLQNQTGAQQQALEQAKINQAMTDYANAQQYPLMQLGTMSNMLRGLPMQASTTNQYAAAPSALSQGIGAAGAYAGLTQAGVIPKAEGGLASVPRYDVGGAVEADLEDMDVDGLQRQIKESSSPRVKQMAQRILTEKRMAQVPGHAGGGIIAFKESNKENNYSLVSDPMGTGASEIMDTPRSANAQSFLEQITNVPQWKTDLRQEQAAKAEQAAAKAAADIPKDKGITEVPAVAKDRVTPATTPAPAPATGPRQPGILSASKPDEFMAPLIKERDRYAKEASQDRGTLAKKLEDEAGPNVGRENYRSEEMARRANLKDEAERQRGMRLAEFFASWGSTPGPVLVAGMTALKKSIPGMVEDTKEAKKLQRESDKIIYDIDEATRLDKAGYRKESQTMIQQAATNAAQLNTAIAHYASTSRSAEASEKNAAATAAASAARSHEAGIENQWRTFNAANQNLARIQGHIDDVRNKPGAYKEAADYLATVKEKDLSKMSDTAKSMYEARSKLVRETDKKLNDSLKDAQEDVDFLRQRVAPSGRPGANTGVELPPELPKGSKQVGTSGGKPVYEAPNGKRYVVQ
jgi:hypothetical protein